jgi:hypothetical protein
MSEEYKRTAWNDEDSEGKLQQQDSKATAVFSSLIHRL